MKPVIGITMGDGCGIGPEIICKALNQASIHEVCRPIVIGDAKILKRAAQLMQLSFQWRLIQTPQEAEFIFGTMNVIDLDNLPADLPFGVIDKRAGKAAYEYLEKAVQLALIGEIASIATAPLNKEALNLAGCKYPGHTEILASLSNTSDYSMMLTSEKLKVIHVTTHVSLRKACDLISKERVLTVIQLAHATLKRMGIENPRIAVAGLNPHAGEGGLFGTEEIESIIPAIEMAQEQGFIVTGPVPPDTVFFRAALRGEFDIVVVMYHDQGHIPIKIMGFETGVNVTVGLPFLRTSVDHGTAFDKAGTGSADCQSMVEAIDLAAKLG